MTGKITWLILLYTAMLCFDIPRWKRSSRRDRLVYSGLLLLSVYLGIVYAAERNWLNLNHLVNYFFAGPAKSIIESIKLPS